MTTAHTRSRGFTLIELLVVISIIGVLSSIVLGSVNKARIKGEDAARVLDVKAIKTAMEFYYDDNNTYPQYGVVDSSYGVTNLSAYLVSGPKRYVGSIHPTLINDGDAYVWGSANSYALYVYTGANGGEWCKTGVNVNTAWWGAGVPICNF